MKINSITQNYYCNSVKSNQEPQFKGTFIKDLKDYQADKFISQKSRKEINSFFKKYMSPGVNVIADNFDYTLTLVPWVRGFHGDCKDLAVIPEEYATDIKYYVTNAKAIEDDVLDMTMNYFKVDKNADKDIDRYNNYIKQQYEYAEKFPERLPASYKAKLDLFKELIDNKNSVKK